MKTLLTITILICLTFNLFSQNWTKVDGVHDRIQKIKYDLSNPDRIIVSSNPFGIDLQSTFQIPAFILNTKAYGIQISNDGGKSFTETQTMDSVFVFDLVQDSKDHDVWYASVATDNNRIMIKSIDGGNSWDFEYSNCEGSDLIHNIVIADDKMFAGAINTSNGLFSSDDNFATCLQNEILNVSIRSFQYSEKFKSLVFSADNKGKPGVYISNDMGETWNKKDFGINGFRIHSVHRSEGYEDMYLCGADFVEIDKSTTPKGLFITTDYGTSWKSTSVLDMYVYDIVAHPKEPLLLAAACGENGIYISGDGGFSWSDFNEDLNDTADIRKVLFPNYDKSKSGYRLLAGSFGEGMYISENVDPEIKGVLLKDNYSFDLEIYPNPTVDYINIKIKSDYNEILEMTITDLLGKKLKTYSKNVVKGENIIKLENLSNLNSGNYFIYIRSNKTKMMLSKFSIN